MDIKRMHDMIETLTECAKHEFDNGVENIDTKEMGEVIDMIKDLAEAEYYRKISVAMDEAEYGEDYDYEGRKGYRGQRRDSRGRYMSRRGYESSMMMHDDREYYRDMDRMGGKMYYTSGGSSMGGSTSGQSGSSSMNSGSSSGQMGYSDGGRDRREGRSGQSRRGYMEAKEQGKDKTEKMKSLEDYMKSMAEDLTEAIENASPEERSMVKNKLSVLTQKM